MMLERAQATSAVRTRFVPVMLLIISSNLLLHASPEKKPASREAAFGGFLRTEIVNAESDPTMRFPVMHWYGSIWSVTYGWFDISRGTVRYEVQQPAKKQDHGFTGSRQSLTKLKWRNNWLSFQAAGKGRNVIFLPTERWGSVHTGIGMNSAAAQHYAFSMGIMETLQNFERALAKVLPPKPPPPAVEAKPAPAAPEPAPATPPPAPPTIVLMQPSVANSGETLVVENPTLTLRGLATDAASLPLVSINGVPANMKARSAQVVEFWSDPVTLQTGENVFEIVAANSAKARSRFLFVARFSPPPPPAPAASAPPPKPEPAAHTRALSKSDVLELLSNYVPSARVAALVRERGIRFHPTPDDLDAVTAAGGAEDLIEALREAGSAVP
jgi:hypothetical protein